MKALGIIGRAATCAAAFWLADLAAMRAQTAAAEGKDAAGIIEAVRGIADGPWTPARDGTSLTVGAAAAVCVLLFWLYRWTMSQNNWRDREEYGSARWAKPEEMAPYTDWRTDWNLQMTLTEGLSIDAAATRRNLNVLVLGGSGSGKTATHVIPNIRKASMNYACTDPKGELFARTAPDLVKAGYDVKKLDLVDLTADTKFNPLDYIDDQKPDVSIMRLVTNIMDNTNGQSRENQTDGFWDKAERSLLTALTAFVYYVPDEALTEDLHIRSGRTLNAVADLTGLMEASEEDENMQSPVDALAETCRELYDEVSREWQQANEDGTVDDELREVWRLAQGVRFAATQYRPFEQGAGETKKSIIISLGVRLAPLQVGEVREILSADNIGIRDIGGYDDGAMTKPHRRTAIFLALPDEDSTFNFLAAIFYQCLFDSIIRRCRVYPGERLATPLHCFLDEFANVGRIPNFDKLIATIRSRQVSVSVILQTIAQLKTMYEKSWETVAGNCDSVLFLGGSEQSTTEWISKLLGKETIDLRTTSDSKGVSGSHTVNYQRTGRELLTPDELAQLDNNLCVYSLRGLHPFKSRKAWPGSVIRIPASKVRHGKDWNRIHPPTPWPRKAAIIARDRLGIRAKA